MSIILSFYHSIILSFYHSIMSLCLYVSMSLCLYVSIVSISDWFTSELTVSMSSGSSSSSSKRRRWWWSWRQLLQINQGRLQAAEQSLALDEAERKEEKVSTRLGNTHTITRGYLSGDGVMVAVFGWNFFVWEFRRAPAGQCASWAVAGCKWERRIKTQSTQSTQAAQRPIRPPCPTLNEPT